MEEKKEVFYQIKYPVWLALYTKPNHERKVHQILQTFKIQSFLPTRIITTKSLREKEVPLFRSYVFLKVVPRTEPFYMAMDLKGVIGYVKFDGVPSIISEEEIITLKKMIEEYKHKVFPVYEISEGKEIKFSRGPFAGYRIIIKEVDHKKSIVVAWIKEIFAGAALNIRKEKLLKWI